jgi:hypothetical protein
MKLIVVHQFLIGSAVCLGALFGVRAIVLYARGAGSENLAFGLVSVAVAVALVFYLRTVREKVRAAKEQGPGPRPPGP